jgi:hypothetical protein
MKKKIRFLATGDFHSDLNLIRDFKKNVDMDSVDYVLFTGDLSDRDDDFGRLLSVFKGKPFIMTAGNHEAQKDMRILEKYYGVHLLGNNPIMFDDDLAFFSSDMLELGPDGKEGEEVLKNTIENFKSVEDAKIKVMLSHLPPEGTEIGSLSPFYPFISGSVVVRFFLENFNPDVALVGHIHEAKGLEEIVNKTKVVNVSKTYKLFEFDTETKKLKFLN